MKSFSHVISAALIASAGLNPRNMFKGDRLIFSAKHRTTYFPPEKRNGAKECTRRGRQGLASTCYVHGAQYI